MVHPCDKPCGNKTASGYCATTACINPQFSNIGTAQYGQGVFIDCSPGTGREHMDISKIVREMQKGE